MKKWRWGLVVAAVLSLAVLAGCASTNAATVAPGNNQQTGIWVTGLGTVTVVPDVAIIRLGVNVQDSSVAAAQARATDAMNKVMAALTAGGVAAKDIQTSFFNISKVTRWDDKGQQEIIIGYRVTNVVTAKVRDISKAGAIIDSAAAAAGDVIQVDSIAMTVDKPTTYHEQARAKAVADAEAKAKQLAREAGLTLGKAFYITESGNSVPPPIYYYPSAKDAASSATPISPGETEINLTVQVAYAIQ